MTSHAVVLPVYKRFRQIGLQLNQKLVKMLSTEALREGGRRLGILKNGTFVFDSEDETSVLMDYCIHNVRTDGVSAVQRYMAHSPPPADSDELMLVAAMLKGYYALIQVIEAERGVGITFRDVLRNDSHFLADIGLGTTGGRGALFATRVFSLEDQGFFVTGGAGLPVTADALIRIKNELNREFAPGTDFSRLTPDQESDLAALVIRVCLRSGMSSLIAYGKSAETLSESGRKIDPRDVRHANPNDPCPCGSGRKFKSCCRRRPRL
jgi:SEC-C motif